VVTMPQMTPVASSNLASVGFDGSTSQLYVCFNNGTMYRYFNTPRVVYAGLMTAASHGHYFNRVIRNRYYYQRIR
jgi:hypothetical protein